MQRWRNYQVCSCVIAILVLSSCASELARRYQDATWDTTSQPYATVSIFTLDTPFTPGQRLFLGLSPEGQAALIEAVKHTTTDTNELLNVLVQGWPSGPNRHAIFDHTRFHKRIVVSVEKHETIAGRPADRIEQLRVVLGDLQNGTFVSWDKLSTEYQDVDLGKLTLVKGITGSGQVDAGGVAGVPVSGRAGVTATRNLTEEVSLKQRYEFLTGILQPTQATISRQGMVGIDLTGTFHIDVTLQATHVQEAQIVRMGTLFAPNGDPVAPSQVALSHAWVKYAERPRIEDHSAEPAPAPPVRPITCRIHMPYVFRSVQAHHNTVVEGDDKVHFLVGNASSDARVELVRAHELHATVYAVGLPDGPEVRIGELKGGFGPARFETYDKAQNFVAWLRRQREALVAGYRIGLVTGQSALTFAPLTTMQREQLAVFPVKLNW
jgi:hypothetical protein